MIHMTLQASPTYPYMNPFATGLSLILRTWFEVVFEGAFTFHVQSKADTMLNFIKTLFRNSPVAGTSREGAANTFDSCLRTQVPSAAVVYTHSSWMRPTKPPSRRPTGWPKHYLFWPGNHLNLWVYCHHCWFEPSLETCFFFCPESEVSFSGVADYWLGCGDVADGYLPPIKSFSWLSSDWPSLDLTCHSGGIGIASPQVDLIQKKRQWFHKHLESNRTLKVSSVISVQISSCHTSLDGQESARVWNG